MGNRLFAGLAGLGFAAAAAAFWKLRIIEPAAGADPAVTNAADLAFYVYPVAHWARDNLLAGTLPLWNPYQGAGHPFLATGLPGIFYPPNLVYLLLPTHVAIEASVVLHLACAGGLACFYARTIGLSRAASLLVGAVYMGSGFVAVQALWFTPALAGCVWLPLALAAADRLCARPGPRWAAVLAVAVAMPALAGWFQSAAYSVYAIAGYAAVRLAARSIQRDGRAHVPFALAALAAGVALGACLAAVQLLPSWELRGESARGGDGPSRAQSLALSPREPDAVLSSAVDARPGYPRWVYVGILPLLLAPLSLLARDQRQRLPALWLLAALGLCVALTVQTPLFDAFRRLPGLGWFRAPQRILFVYAFALAALAGIGFDALLARGSRAPVRLGAAIAVALVLALALALDAPTRALVYWALGATALAGIVWVESGPVLRAAPLALLSLVAWDLFHATRNAEFRPYHDARIYDSESELLEYVRANQGLQRTYFRVSGWRNPGLMHKQASLRGIFSITDYEPLSLARHAAFYRLLGDPLRPQLTFVGRLLTEPDEPHFRLLDLLSVRFLVIHEGNQARRRDLEEAGWRPAFGWPAGHWRVYENPRPLPRAYVAHRARTAPGGDEALAILADPGFDFRTEAVVETPGGDPSAVASGAPRPLTPARILRYGPKRVEVDVDIPERGILVLTDSFYPGWLATVDGEPREILRANYLFRGVPLEPGSHTVVFRYRPASFRLGASITLGAVLILVAGSLARRDASAARGARPSSV